MSEEYTSPANSVENITEDYGANDNNTTGFPLPFSNRDAAVVCGLVLPMAVFGIVVNVITILVVNGSPKLNSIFHLYIISMCVSDVISAILSPFFLNRLVWGFDDWKISSFLCKVYFGGDISTSVATSLHILMFSLLRFISITRPHEFRRIKPIHAKISVLSIWAVSFVGSFVPYMVWFSARIIDRSVESIDRAWPSCVIEIKWVKSFHHFSLYGFTIFFYIPLVLIFVLSSATAVAISIVQRKRNKANQNRSRSENNETELHRRRKENQAIVQLAFIVGSYALGYIPMSAFWIVVSRTKVVTHEDRVFQWKFIVGTYLCLRFSECLNPIFYNLSSSKIRKETFTWLQNLFGVKKPSNSPASTGITLNTIKANTSANQNSSSENGRAESSPFNVTIQTLEYTV